MIIYDFVLLLMELRIMKYMLSLGIILLELRPASISIPITKTMTVRFDSPS